ncbi:hypothetical protein BHE74_00039650 [Ensete ventricosum]|uniref:sucrose synthase n=1 Tax=Ensete ventricosum TaxID=4639 RepID=A0A426ZUL7_ENSVE|nr:hypothetical protein B296_00039045 [Ensete ventricosum]RWW22276.1 hypothetical protein GW17_00013538 [Ensete ventricosum]RWW53815.1 hypothetical protein BHE74_00039650 [Ensete ventricosum]RZR84971.1 hypothetical protein BHM03_00011891 [Ensete ventricosum]
MTCGLPTFATAYGGPAEIIVHGVSGFHIDPYQKDKAAEILVGFFEKCKEDSTHWDKISQGGLQRIYEKYALLLLFLWLSMRRAVAMDRLFEAAAAEESLEDGPN